MFRESLIETVPTSDQRRRWTTLVSFFIQAVFVCAVLAFPLLVPATLPMLRADRGLPLPPPSAPMRGRTPDHVGLVKPPSELRDGVLVEPTFIPTTHAYVPPTQEQAAEIGDGFSDGPWVPYSIPGGTQTTLAGNRVITDMITGIRPPAVKRAETVRVSPGVVEGMLVRRVVPQYPGIARTAGIQGDVVIDATIGRDGTVQGARVMSGHPLLVAAALEAVKQWRYRPFMLGNEPVEVAGQITVKFMLR